VGWHAIELLDSVQVVPDYEHDHILGLTCWCAPHLEPPSNTEARPLVSHRDIVERTGLPVDEWQPTC
jgi:hypothetical protein